MAGLQVVLGLPTPSEADTPEQTQVCDPSHGALTFAKLSPGRYLSASSAQARREMPLHLISKQAWEREVLPPGAQASV